MREVLDTTLASIVGSEDQQRAPEYGKRAWRLRGTVADVIYWDIGNGWYDIIQVAPRAEGEAFTQWLKRFFEQVEASEDM